MSSELMTLISSKSTTIIRNFMQYTGASGYEETYEEWIYAAGEENLILCCSHFFIAAAIAAFIGLQIWSANYGRYAGNSWFSINATFAWFIQELPSLAVAMIALHDHGDELNLARFLAFAMFTGHYFQRTMIYPFLTKGSKPTPPYIFFCAFAYCAINGYLQAVYHIKYADFDESHARDIVSQIGIVIFLTGMFINLHSDSILRGLRPDDGTQQEDDEKVDDEKADDKKADDEKAGDEKANDEKADDEKADDEKADDKKADKRTETQETDKEQKADKKKKYKIPYGGFFKYVSSANYFGEIVEWTGYAIYCRTTPAVAFAFFTICNLAPRAKDHHEWYKAKFEEKYPKDRKVLIPYIY